jgi:hypothetical protein
MLFGFTIRGIEKVNNFGVRHSGFESLIDCEFVMIWMVLFLFMKKNT